LDRNGLVPPLEDNTERPKKGPDQSKTKEEAVDRSQGQRPPTQNGRRRQSAQFVEKYGFESLLIQFQLYMVSADYEHSRVVMPKGRGETSSTKEAPEKENEAKVPEHFKELVEGELCLTPAHTKEAGDEPVKKKQERIQTILGTEEAPQVLAIGAGWRG